MSGLLSRISLNPLPLRSSSIYAEIRGFTSRTTAVLTYYNDHRSSIEGLFVLPLDHHSAVVEFECLVEGRYITAEVCNAGESKEPRYTSEAQHFNVFSVSVGDIGPWVLIEVQVTLVCEIAMQTLVGDVIEYRLPQTFSPKLVAQHTSTGMDAESTLSYSFQIEIFIDAPCLLCGVQSNTHPIQVDAPPLSQTGSRLRVTLPDEYQPTDHVFELLMFLCRPREPYIFIEEPLVGSSPVERHKNPITDIMNNPILMLSYFPDIETFQKEIRHKQTKEFLLVLNTTLSESFLMSMKEACILTLKSLPTDCYINIYSLNIAPFATCSQKYDAATLEACIAYIDGLVPGDSVTSLLAAVEWVYTHPPIEHTPKQVMIVTPPGSLSHCTPAVEVVRKKYHLARIFTFCTEENDSFYHQVLTSLTKGKSSTINEQNQSEKMLECLKMAVQPAVTDLKVSWILPDAYDVIYTPENLPALYLQDRLNLYAILATKEVDDDPLRLESSNSIKEFWFEDFDSFEELTFDGASSRELVTETLSAHELDLHENEVFLTEEEATSLGGTIRRKRIESVHNWKISKNPHDTELPSQNVYEENTRSLSDSEKGYSQCSEKTSSRKRSSGEGSESWASSTSNASSFLPFPGYPTRLSSCRSLEMRSPHVSKHCENIFQFHTDHEKKKVKSRRKITQKLLEHSASTHLLDYSNEEIVVRHLDEVVTEKRAYLQEWVELQEEMTQCSWPKHKESEWRDSGFGRHSSYDQRSSDDEPRRVGSKSSSGYFEQEDNFYKPNMRNLNKSIDTVNLSDIKTKTERFSPPHTSTSGGMLNQASSSENISSKKPSKSKVVFSSFFNKIRSFANTVSEKSKPSEDFTSFPGSLKRKLTRKGNLSKNSETMVSIDSNEKKAEQTARTIEQLVTIIKETEPRKTETGKIAQPCQVRSNRPVIENSRTISTASMFEIGQSEIGDVDNLHLLPSQALIYLSGQLGRRAFKRIIPFQLVFENEKRQSQDEQSNNLMHQLAAKSIIKDLEIQLVQDTMLENTSREYIKSLIREVSVASNVPSKYTAVVLNDDLSREGEVMSMQVDTYTHNRNTFQMDTNVRKKRESLSETTSETLKKAKQVWKFRYKAERNFVTLIKHMHYDGSWLLSPQLSTLFSVHYQQLVDSCPFNQHLNQGVWDTAVALSWLRAFWSSAEAVWLVAEEKSRDWLSGQRLPRGYMLDDILLLAHQALILLDARQ